jgi:RNA polymerase sigma factor (sigma-70 family)
VAGARDSSDVPVASELRDEELVRLFAHARDRGDRDRAVRIWEQIVINNADRVTAWVAAWRYPGSGDRVQEVDRDEAVSRAFWKVGRKMVDTFQGDTLPELRAAIKRAVDFACRDTLRHVATYDRHHAGSLDEPAGEGSSACRYDAELADEGGFAELDRSQERVEAADRVARALAQLPQRNRQVLQMTLDEQSVSEIAATLDTSEQNVHQLRSRGMKKLKEVLDHGLD